MKETGLSQITDMEHQITVTLPDHVYQALRRRAKARKKSVREMAEETLRTVALSDDALPPSRWNQDSRSLDAELQALATKSDEELWQIAESQLPPAQRRRLARLVSKHEWDGALTAAEQREWKQLVEQETRLTVIKSEAYVLLKQRGHRIPTLEELQRRRRRR